ncbi:hypothetical protein BDP67DRAFT_510182 [Colletotrichum lupini]|nr:hypothetical protein BDP67DRAFT_510182 [Colletotrichum lupini]
MMQTTSKHLLSQQTTDNRAHDASREREQREQRAQVEVAVPLRPLLTPDDAAVSTDLTGLLDFWILDSGLWADPRWTEGATNSRGTSRYGDMYPTTSSGRRAMTRSPSTTAADGYLVFVGLLLVGPTGSVSTLWGVRSTAKPKQHQSLFFPTLASGPVSGPLTPSTNSSYFLSFGLGERGTKNRQWASTIDHQPPTHWDCTLLLLSASRSDPTGCVQLDLAGRGVRGG